MEKELKKILQGMNASEIGIDDTFKFHCTKCGECCYHRSDIILTPNDLYNAANELKITIKMFMEKYCGCNIGQNSKLPVVYLYPVGSQRKCPLLENNLCRIHNAKPVVCALFPIGRSILAKVDEDDSKLFRADKIRYLYTNPECGDDSQIHIVREWLSQAGFSTEDEIFLYWHRVLYRASKYMDACMEEFRVMDGIKAMEFFFSKMYMEYDLSKEFLPQFISNAEAVLSFVGKEETKREVG